VAPHQPPGPAGTPSNGPRSTRASSNSQRPVTSRRGSHAAAGSAIPASRRSLRARRPTPSLLWSPRPTGPC
jgi:hypothetical protein